MKNFKDLGITVERKGFVGDKIKISKVLNREIVVYDFKIEPSKHTERRLDLQISVDNTKHVIFTGSKFLIEMIQQVPKTAFPFRTTIKEDDNEAYYFT